MESNLKKTTLTVILFVLLLGLKAQTVQYTMPEETVKHEGTWLQWPHHYTYGMFYRNSLDSTWIKMTSALSKNENVHIIAYNEVEKNRITALLNDAGISLSNIDFYLHPTDDVWVRDNGPVFVLDSYETLTVLDWGFNGWGNDTPYGLCDLIPQKISSDIDVPIVDLSEMVLEPGAVEHDGYGTMMATKSSVTDPSRNPDLTVTKIENYLKTYMGFTKFIWLDGADGGLDDITDMHIDGFMKFADKRTILTMNNTDLLYWGLSQSDIDKLYSAADTQNNPYNFVCIPLTQQDVTTEYGSNLGYKGSYANYYVANTVVLVPNYDDPNDIIANNIIQNLYPNRTVVGIDVRNLYKNGGMVHCVTQQQPAADNSSSMMKTTESDIKLSQNTPNPFNPLTTIQYSLPAAQHVTVRIFDIQGKEIAELANGIFNAGVHNINFNGNKYPSGQYFYTIMTKSHVETRKMLLVK